MNFPKDFSTILELVSYFKDEDVCRAYLEKHRWENGPICPYCSSDRIMRFSNGKTFKCHKCRQKFSVKVGTIFEDSKISLQKWYIAIYLLTSHKKGISSLQLSKDIGVTQKTAWFMLQRIRYAFGYDDSSTEKLKNVVEVDETYIGGAEKNKHIENQFYGTQGRSLQTKTPVVGMLERGGNVVAMPIPDTKSATITPIVVKHIDTTAQVMTDEWWGYNKLKTLYDHSVVKHGDKQYVVYGNGAITHTNTIEGFWSLLKRGIIGIYHQVSTKHLAKYVNEFAFRYNTRELLTATRFQNMLEKSNCRLTYKVLIQTKGVK